MPKCISRAVCSLCAVVALTGGSSAAMAQSDPLLGQIMCGAFNFAPRGWLELNGQTLAISQNSALFSLLGTQYGGNGQTTFMLPDMRGRVLVHAGSGSGLTPRNQGEVGGAEAVSLTTAQLPAHTHGIAAPATTAAATSNSPTNAVPATTRGNVKTYGPGPGDTAMAPGTTTTAGGGNPVPVMPPFVTVRCFIAAEGIYPSRP